MSKSWHYDTLLPDARPTSDASARAFIDEIRTRWGFYSVADEAEWRNVPERLRKQNEILRNQQHEVVAGHTRLAAEGLYTTKFRFIHEIIQNADDANYGMVNPHLCIIVEKDKIIFKSNEQGFTAKDVASLCHIGQSSKSADEETTGEKGLGFKSVFGVANKVHVQSGYWSFAFLHQEGDPGIGMVIPTWIDHSQGYIEGTTLTLHYSVSTEEFTNKLLAVLRSVRHDFILALKRLQKVSIIYQGFGNREQSRIFERVPHPQDGSIQIHSTIGSEKSYTRFLIFRNTLTSMPKGPFRSRDSTQVMMAFPVNEKNSPNVPADGNYVYATLPVRRIPNLRFIVQADFTLLPSRENLNDSTWNNRIISSLPIMFASAVENFCLGHPKLKYEWPDFLPGSLAAEEDCWSSLRNAMLYQLAQRHIIELRSTNEFRCPRDARIVSDNFLDDDAPLFDDLVGREVYVSDGYSKRSLKLLRETGLKEITQEEMYARIAADVQSKTPRHKKPPLRDDWHMNFLSLVDEMCANPHLKKMLRGLDIIPLATNGHWCTPGDSEKTYLPYVELNEGRKLDLPGNLRLRKLNPDACCNEDPDFERLYCKMGVLPNTFKDVVDRIVKLHQSWVNISDTSLAGWRIPGTIEDWQLNYEILFWQGISQSYKGLIPMAGLDASIFLRQASHIYFASDAPYNAHTLLKDAMKAKDPAMAGYGFLNPVFVSSEMQSSIRNHMTWNAWLEQVAGIRYYPPLIEPTGDASNRKHSLHRHLKYVGQHRSKDFVALLQAHWHSSYKNSCDSAGDNVKGEISEIFVPCSKDTDVKITQSILPTHEIMAVVDRYGITKQLPLLTLPTELTVNNQQEWMFLERFGVLTVINKQFYIAVLVALKESKLPAEQLEKFCVEVYGQLVKICSVGDKDWLLNELSQINGTFIPGDVYTVAGSQWVDPQQCVWTGPSVLRTKVVLQHQYARHEIAQKFFHDLLGLPDATCNDIIYDLMKRSEEQREGVPSLEDCKELYGALALLAENADSRETIVAEFRENSLIFAAGRWFRVKECIWNGRVHDLQSLETLYSHLRKFFVNRLGVTVLSSRVVWAQLVKACQQGSEDASAFKELIIILGQTLSTESSTDHIRDGRKEVKDLAFLPLRGSPGSKLASIGTEFCVVDDERLGNVFEGRLQVLDFTLVELTNVEIVLRLLDLESRYLTKCVDTRINIRDHQINTELSDHVRYRAYALSRCAIAHRSPKFFYQNTTTYDMISKCNIFTCKEVDTYLVVRQCGRDISVQSPKPAIKVEVNDGMLSIFAPHDNAALVACARTDLPKQLMKILGISKPTAERQIYRILTEDDEKLDEVLQQEDLPTVTWLQPPSTRQTSPSILSQNGNVDRLDTITSGNSSSNAHSQGSDSEPSAPVRTNLFRRVVENNAYEKFLVNIVIPQARGQEIISTQPPSTDGLEDIGSYKIGAAGELFVFERLKMELPQFTAENWKSKIRTYVNVVPGYDLSQLGDTETADFEYKDNSGNFKKFLKQHSHNKFQTTTRDTLNGLVEKFRRLSFQKRRLADVDSNADSDIASSEARDEDQADESDDNNLPPIKFFIEVKATPGPCEQPFFISPNQYKHMKKYSIQLGLRPHEIYVIFRVYNLFSHDIKFKIFVDPWNLRDGMLQFSADPWKVIGPCPEVQP